MNAYFPKTFQLCVISILAIFGCDSMKAPEVVSPAGYDFSSGEKIYLLNKLEEVSGIAFVPGSDSMLMAINDEVGRMYPVNINQPKLAMEGIKFSGGGDYEDIAFFAGKWRILRSNGAIHTSGGDTANTAVEPIKLLPGGEYEGMAAAGDTLFVICKECPANDETGSTVYKITANGDSLILQGTITFNSGEMLKGKQKKFLASALAKHPVTGEWYILSHLRGGLLITGPEFQTKQFIPFLRSRFLQPEGIAFASNGDLLISSEGDESDGYILRFTYKPAK